MHENQNSGADDRIPDPHNPGKPAEAADGKKTKLRSEDLQPFFSLRLLSAAKAGPAWTDDWLRVVRGIEKVAFSAFPEKKPEDLIDLIGGFIPFEQSTSRRHFRLGKREDDGELLGQIAVGQTGWMSGRVIRVKAKPSWMKKIAPELTNVTYHLLCIAVFPPFVAVSATQEALGRDCAGIIEMESGRGDDIPLRITSIPHEILDVALVKGEALSVALDGMHRPTVFKADRQILLGRDVRRAIDPVGYRTYAYASVRSLLDAPFPERKKRGAVGYSRKQQLVWAGPTKDAADYLRHLVLIASLVNKATLSTGSRAARAPPIDPDQNGLRYLSEQIDPSHLSDAKQPFEVEWDLGEPINEAIPAETDKTEARQEWLAHGQLEMIDPPGAAMTQPDEMVMPVRALWDRTPFARFDVAIHRGAGHAITVSFRDVTRLKSGDGRNLLRAYEVFDSIEVDPGPKALTIRFESGHVLDQQRLYLPETPSVPFEDWRWVRLDLSARRFDCTKEKPKPWNVTRSIHNYRAVKNGDDLFSYIVHRVSELQFLQAAREWFLLCHDQPNEVADFVLIVPATRSLTHLHAKGAHSDDPGRRVSIGAYDLVVTQAIKNLVRLDTEPLIKVLTAGNTDPGKIGQFIVSKSGGGFDHSFNTRPFMDGLHAMRGRPLLEKRVIIFQPHIREQFWRLNVEKWRSGSAGAPDDPHPIFMLSSLLIDAKIACMRLGAQFEVWGEWDGAGDPPSAFSPFA